MKKIRLAILIPLLLILSSLMSSALLCLNDMRVANRTIEQAGFNDINITMTHLQNMLDSQLASENLEEAKLSLSVSAMHPNIQTMLLADEKDTVLLANSYIWAGNRAALVSGYDEPTARQARQTRTSFRSINTDRTRLSGYYPITLKIEAGGLGTNRIGLLFVEYDLSPGLARARYEAVIQAAAFGGLMITVSIAVAILLHWMVSRRVAKIGAVSQRFAAGDHEARVHLRGGDELAELGNAFDQMADKIASDQRSLRDSERKLSLHLRQTILGVIEWDRAFRAREWNPAAELIFGYNREEALGRHAADLILPSGIAEEIDNVWRQILSQAGGSYNVNENVTRDGRTIICEWFNTPLVDDNGSVTGVMSLARDVTDEKRAEETLHLQAAELEEEVAERQMAQETLQNQAILLENEIEERRNAQEELEQLNESLEQRVQERTAELEAKNAELHKMNRLFVGRELRMVELKKQIRELEEKATVNVL